MGFRCGIVGLPNVGKSTLFNALTQSSVDASNYPFCTVEPNTGIVPIPDQRLKSVADLVGPDRSVPSVMTFVDIAGLIGGASAGEGLGNQFLAQIRETDAIAHVVRCFANDNVVHVAGRVDPLADIGVVNTELALADLEQATRARERTERLAKVGDKRAQENLATLEYVCDALDAGTPLRTLGLTAEQKHELHPFYFLTAKPVMYIANVDEQDITGSADTVAIQERAAEEGAQLVIVSSEIEAEIAQLADDEQSEYLSAVGIDARGLDRVINVGYELLGLHHFFSAEPNEVKAWTIAKGTNAEDAAGAIHSDFKRGFIRAEVCSYDHFIAANGEAGAKKAGTWRSEGRDYIVQDGDVIRFRFNV